MTNWDHLDALGITPHTLGTLIGHMQIIEMDTLRRIREYGPAEIRNRRLASTRVVLAQLNRAAGIDPVADARVRAGFPR